MTSDFKNPPRYVATSWEWDRIRELKARECRLCGNTAWSHTIDPHHLVARSLGGDDVQDNIVGLCRTDHEDVEDWDEQSLLRLGLKLSDREILYVLGKKGSDYLARRYKVVVQIGNTYVKEVAA